MNCNQAIAQQAVQPDARQLGDSTRYLFVGCRWLFAGDGLPWAFGTLSPTGVRRLPEMLFKTNDRLHLADLIAICRFSTEFSLGLSLRHPGENEGGEIGWMDLHLTRNDQNQKIHFRICLQVDLTTQSRIDWLRQDSYRALAIPDSANYEITLFWPDRSVLMIDDREGFICGSGFTIPPQTPLLDYQFEDE